MVAGGAQSVAKAASTADAWLNRSAPSSSRQTANRRSPAVIAAAREPSALADPVKRWAGGSQRSPSYRL